MMTGGPILRYCPACHFTSRTPFLYHGSRYGHVGAFSCEGCGERVNLLDRDCYPPVRYFAQTDTGESVQETILYEDLYRINEPDFRRMERWTGLGLLSADGDKALDFGGVVTRVAAEVQRRELALRPASYGLPFVTWVPEPFREWLDLYTTLEPSPGP